MNPHARALVLGISEGLVLFYILESHFSRAPSNTSSSDFTHVIASGLACGLGGRMLWDYAHTGEVEILARGVIGIAVGVFIAELAQHGWDELSSRDERMPSTGDLRRRHRRRRIHRVDEEFVRPPSPPNAPPEPSTSAADADLLRRGRRDVDEGDLDEVASLERDVSVAAGQHRRLQEEKEWARSQGNSARQFQLESEIRRYQALSAELERKLRHRKSISTLVLSLFPGVPHLHSLPKSIAEGVKTSSN
jgi:hypothetical protein